MREQIRDKGRLEHMLEAIDNVIEFTNGVTLEGLSDYKVRVQEAWNIVKDDIPPLRKQIEDCIREL